MKYGSEVKSMSNSGMIGIGWASSGGEATAIFNEKYLAADGIENVIRVLDQIERTPYDDYFYITAISHDIDEVGVETNELTLTKWIKIDRETDGQ